MRIGLVHLSDIHLSDGQENPVLSRSQQIAAAAGSALLGCERVFLLVSGDIAFKGSGPEYDLADALIESIRGHLEATCARPVSTILVPGNHDCQFPTTETDKARSKVISNLTESEVDHSVIQLANSPQQTYFAFHSKHRSCDSLAGDIDKELHEIQTFQVGDLSVAFQLINSAWVSQLHEDQGSLFFPVQKAKEKLQQPTLVVSMLHHPYNWFAADNARQLRTHLENTSDLILTGHEHDPTTYRKTRHRRAKPETSVEYVEGGVLQESGEPSVSSFNVLTADIQQGRFKVVTFSFNTDIYRAKDHDTWREFTRNLYRFRKPFTQSQKCQELVSDPGAAYSHPSRKEPRLQDVFVYPDFRESRTAGKKALSGERLLRSPVVQFVVENRRVLITGPEKAGKSAVARRLVDDLHEAGCIPLLAPGKRIRPKSLDATQRMVRGLVTEQYSKTTVDYYLQLPIQRRAIVVDDWDRVGLNQRLRNDLLKHLHSLFGVTVIFAEGTNLLDELVERNPDSEFFGLLEYSQLEILEFGYLKRSELVDRWFSFGDSWQETEESELLRQKREIEGKLDSLIGKGLVPAYPVFVLILLQELNAQKTVATTSGSQGYLYEVLITTSLAKSNEKGVQIDSKYNYLSELAHHLHSEGTIEIGTEALLDWHKGYIENYLWNIDFQSTLDDLCSVHILENRDDRIRFRYPYLRYYFVARYMRDHIGEPAIRSAIEQLTESLYSEDSANILIFLAYLSRDPFVIDTMLEAAQAILPSFKECDLAADGDFLTDPEVNIPSLELDVGVDPEENRKSELAARDRSSKSQSSDSDSDGRAPRLPAEIDAALRTVQILGQVLRNFPGSLRGERKVELAEASLSLGLRLLAKLFDEINIHREDLKRSYANLMIKLHPESAKDRLGLSKQANSMIFGLTESVAFGVVKHVSTSLGMEELAPVFKRLNQGSDNSSHKIVDLSIQLDHYSKFPKGLATELHSDYDKTKRLLATVLVKHLVWYHFHLFPEPHRLRQEVCSSLGIKLSADHLRLGTKLVPRRK